MASGGHSCAQLRTHLDTDLLWMCLHGLQSGQRPTTLNDDPAVLRLAKGQNRKRCTAVFTNLSVEQAPKTLSAQSPLPVSA